MLALFITTIKGEEDGFPVKTLQAGKAEHNSSCARTRRLHNLDVHT
jgi:hypothetical protein